MGTQTCVNTRRWRTRTKHRGVTAAAVTVVLAACGADATRLTVTTTTGAKVVPISVSAATTADTRTSTTLSELAVATSTTTLVATGSTSTTASSTTAGGRTTSTAARTTPSVGPVPSESLPDTTLPAPSAAKRRAQTISFPVPPDVSFDARAVGLSAAASSGLPVTFAVSSGPCRGVPGGSVELLHASASEPCVVRAEQPGDDTFAAAPVVERSFLVNEGHQEVVGETAFSREYGDVDLASLGVHASSGRALRFVLRDPVPSGVNGCGQAGVTITSQNAGHPTCVVDVVVEPSEDWLPAPPFSLSVNFVDVRSKLRWDQPSQTIALKAGAMVNVTLTITVERGGVTGLSPDISAGSVCSSQDVTLVSSTWSPAVWTFNLEVKSPGACSFRFRGGGTIATTGADTDVRTFTIVGG